MANAILLKPEAFTATAASGGTVTSAQLMANDYAGLVWRPPTGDYVFFSFDLGTDMSVDTIGMFGLAGMDAAARWTILLATAAQGPVTSGSSYWQAPLASLLAGSARQVSGKGAALWTAPTSGGPPAAIRYGQIQINQIGASNQLIAARMAIGKRIVLERNFQFGGAFGVRDFGSLEFSGRGNLLRRRGRRLRSAGISFPNVRRDEAEQSMLPLLELAGNTDPVLVVTDPDPHAMRERRMFFGPFMGDLTALQRSAAGWTVPVNLMSLF